VAPEATAARSWRRGLVVVLGLGPAGPDLLTSAASQAIARIPRRFVRTARHPSSVAVPDAVSFDSVYESASNLEAVYAGIVDALAEAAAEEGEVLYAVPGSPLVAERTVELLLADERVDVSVVAGLSFLDLVSAWTRWRPASDWWTGTGSGWRRRASGARWWSPSAIPGPCCPT
jgi:uncharacterized protein YabN with tetrapyrrole methylase and pyrophosphatase domain